MGYLGICHSNCCAAAYLVIDLSVLFSFGLSLLLTNLVVIYCTCLVNIVDIWRCYFELAPCGRGGRGESQVYLCYLGSDNYPEFSFQFKLSLIKPARTFLCAEQLVTIILEQA